MNQCPNCCAIWTLEEIDWQQCDACGWPNNDEASYEPNEPDMNGSNEYERQEMQYRIQRDLK